MKQLKPIQKIGKENESSSSFGATLSACMIVRNEEEFLPGCLDSIRDAVDEIVVVDTGSTDRTVEIAESFGAKVYRHAWNDNFTEARNCTLSYATCDWILQIDADEVLEQEDMPLLREAIKSDLYNGVLIAIYNHMPNGLSKFYYKRLFRRGVARYEGIVHEQIIVEGPIVHAEIRIYHYGYNLSKEKMAAKDKRNKELLLRQIEEDPKNTFAWCNLNRIYRSKGEFAKAVKNGKHALSLKRYEEDTATYLTLLYDTAYCCLKTEHLDEGEKLCHEGLRHNPENLNLLFTLGGIYFKQERYDEAIQAHEEFLRQREIAEKRPNLDANVVDTWSYGSIVRNNSGLCYRLLGDYDKAIDCLESAITQDDQHLNLYKSLFLCYIEIGDFLNAQLVLKRAVEVGIADDFTFVKLGDLYRRENRFNEAIKQYEKAIKINPDNSDAYNGWGYALLMKGQKEDADLKFSKALELNPYHERAHFNLVKLKFSQGAHQKALEEIDKLVSLKPESGQIYRDAGDICIKLGNYEKAIELYKECIKKAPADKVTMCNMGSCYAKLGHLESAQMAYQTALSIDPNYAEAARNLSIIDNAIAKVGEEKMVDAAS